MSILCSRQPSPSGLAAADIDATLRWDAAIGGRSERVVLPSPGSDGRSMAVPDENLGSDLRPVVLRGTTVRRQMHPWSAAVHGLLRHLEAVGFPAPRLLDVEGDQEVLTFLPGSSGAEAWAAVVSEAGLQAFARFLRRYHDAVREFRPDTPFVT